MNSSAITSEVALNYLFFFNTRTYFFLKNLLFSLSLSLSLSLSYIYIYIYIYNYRNRAIQIEDYKYGISQVLEIY